MNQYDIEHDIEELESVNFENLCVFIRDFSHSHKRTDRNTVRAAKALIESQLYVLYALVPSIFDYTLISAEKGSPSLRESLATSLVECKKEITLLISIFNAALGTTIDPEDGSLMKKVKEALQKF